jgi:hypothetical protein
LQDDSHIDQPAVNSYYNVQALKELIAAPWPTLMFHSYEVGWCYGNADHNAGPRDSFPEQREFNR